jgi:hypothetical protein
MKYVPAAVVKTVCRTGLLAQKNSPRVLFGTGVVGMVGSTVLACRATLKMHEVLEQAQMDLETAKILEHPTYSDRDRRKDISIIHAKTTVKIVRLYSPSVMVGMISVALLTRSHIVLTRRNTALTAAYAALDQGFNQYRGRVIDKYGEEEDQNFRYGTRKDVIEHPNNPDKTKKVTRTSLDEPSIYAKFFDASSPSWDKEPEYNLIFLKAQQNYFNDQLRARGHVFLNEIYEALGLPHTKPGSVVGWVYDPNGMEGDNYINFGVFDDKQQVRDFVNGHEGSILLDFNVDGIIYDKLES